MLARPMTVVLFLILASCSQKNSDNPDTANPGGPNANPQGNDSCAIYPTYSVGDCKALTKYGDINSSSKAAYIYPVLSDPRYPVPARLIDLTQLSGEASFTKNFKVKDFMSPIKGRYGIFSAYVVSILQVIRDSLNIPIQINSGYRNPLYNDGVGGVGHSRHMYGDGVDIQSPQATPQKLGDACRAQGASYIQLYTDGHAHCDWRNHSLDTTFYGDAAILSTDVQPMSDHDFLAFQYEISGTPSIIIEGETEWGKTINVKASLEHQEDPEELLIEWAVHLPDGSQIQETSSELHLDLKLVGQYQISVRTGGYVESSTSVDVKP